MLSYKSTQARTYTRTLKPREEGTHILGLNNGEIPVEYETACRLCLDKTEIMTEIFGEEDSIVPITVKIKYLLGIEVFEEDRLPTLICHNCLNHLNDAYNFKKRCLASDVKLRQYLCLPLKQFELSHVEPKNKDKEKECDLNTCSLEEDLISLKPLKEECTIIWDDQVPLAAIITSGAPEISNISLTAPIRNTSNSVGITENDWRKDLYNDNHENDKELHISDEIQTEKYTTKPRRLCYQNISQSQQKQQSAAKKSAPPKSAKALKVVKTSSGFVGKIKPDVNKADQNQTDRMEISLDDTPLSDRIKIEKQRLRMLKRKRPKKVKNAKEESNSESEQNLELSVKPKEYVGPLSGFRNMHVCPTCSKAFLTPSLLTRHMRVHSGERPFRCEHCESAFSQNEILQRHKDQVHAKQKPHKCQHCGKAYATLSLLGSHIKSAHVRYGNYKCTHCPKIFRHASGLSRHQNTHNGTYFYCRICGRHFNDGSSVKRHVMTHAGVVVEMPPDEVPESPAK